MRTRVLLSCSPGQWEERGVPRGTARGSQSQVWHINRPPPKTPYGRAQTLLEKTAEESNIRSQPCLLPISDLAPRSWDRGPVPIEGVTRISSQFPQDLLHRLERPCHISSPHSPTAKAEPPAQNRVAPGFTNQFSPRAPDSGSRSSPGTGL